jgi:hypothetical protein
MLRAASQGKADDGEFFAQFEHYEPQNPTFTLERSEALLKKCRMLEPDIYARLHKGTPFYWLAWTAFVFHDYETAAFYIDAAMSEDLRRAPGTTSRPALLFFLIDVQDPKQALSKEVRILHSRIDKEILRYNNRSGAANPPLEFFDLRRCLLEPALAQGKEHLRTLVTTFISFFLEWEHRSELIDLRTLQGTAEPFFIHLFKGCVLFESLLKASQPPPQATMLGPLLREMHSRLNFSGDYLRISPFEFPTVVQGLASDDDTVRTACERTGRIRNSTGHNLGWSVALNRSEYDRLAGYVASSCLHAVACLYR